MTNNTFYLWVLFITISCFYTECGTENCPKNTTLKTRGQDCQFCVKRGKTAKLPPCEIINKTKCYCNEGFIRLNPESIRCVRPEDCPLSCDINEVKVDCTNVCQKTCYEPNKRPCYPYVCFKGCECKKGFIRRHDFGKCIPENQCRNCTDPNMQLVSHCDCVETCQNRDRPPTICPTICLEKCVCQNDYILDEETGKCVKRMDCPLQPPEP